MAHPASQDRAGGPTGLSPSTRSQPEALIPCAFTPGPWFVSPDEIEDESSGCPVLTVGPHEGNHYEEMLCEVFGGNHDHVANAALIAASPDLYEALLGLMPHTFTNLDPTNPAHDGAHIAHWEREQSLGNEAAKFVLAGFAALRKARGISDCDSDTHPKGQDPVEGLGS